MFIYIIGNNSNAILGDKANDVVHKNHYQVTKIFDCD